MRFDVQLPLPEADDDKRVKRRRDVAGLALIAGGLLTFLALTGLDLGVLTAWAAWLRRAFGLLAMLLALVVAALGVPIVLNSEITRTSRIWLRIVQFEICFVALLVFTHALLMLTSNADGAALAQAGRGGGWVGFVLATLLGRAIGGLAVAAFVSLVAVLGAAGLLAGPLARSARAVATWMIEHVAVINPASPVGPAPLERVAPPVAKVPVAAPAEPAPKPEAARRSASVAAAKPEARPAKEAPAAAKVTVITAKRKRDKAELVREPTLPPMALLKYAKNTAGSTADVTQQARVIEETLRHFGLVGHVREIRQGPAVTQFGVEPGYLERTGPGGEARQHKIRVGQIAALHNDLALALSAASLRIEAPIPGKQLVGIEVPNSTVGAVDLRALMESEAFQKVKSPLAIALGRDVSGAEYVGDLGRMPHLLIAGTTGSGKSVCVSALCVGLAMNNHPDDLKLVLIDPKRVELSRFAGLPHVIGKPEADMDRIPGVLRWVTHEMDGRYKKFSLLGARNIADFNAGVARRAEEDPDSDVAQKMPHIVILIDELADLMLQSPIETEKTLCRLAQMARATGIHLVVATQRPSVDVVTGLIKANFPARISFAVASAMDSRVIIDQTGAEALLGRGDMLFLNPEAGSPIRLQGCFVSDKEVDGLIHWWKSEMQTEQAEEETQAADAGEEYQAYRKPKLDAPWDLIVAELASERAMASGGRAGQGSGDDELLTKAMEIIRASGNVSTSLLQRKLRLGYPRAKALMEELEEMGYVGGASKQAGKGREVRGEDEITFEG